MKFRAKRSLGQNFLIDKNILKKIVESGNISKEDNILEIGPGSGNLTEYLIKSKPKNIIVVEKDFELIKILLFTSVFIVIHWWILFLWFRFFSS